MICLRTTYAATLKPHCWALRNGNDVGQAKLALARAITDIETLLGDIDGDNIKAAWIRLKEMAAS